MGGKLFSRETPLRDEGGGMRDEEIDTSVHLFTESMKK
jgi:hypothetical protein